MEWVAIFSLLLLLLLLSRFSRVQLCATPYTAAHQAPLSQAHPAAPFLSQCVREGADPVGLVDRLTPRSCVRQECFLKLLAASSLKRSSPVTLALAVAVT